MSLLPNAKIIKMFYRVGRLFINCRTVHFHQINTINIHYTSKNVLNNFTKIKNGHVRQKSIFQFFSKETITQIKEKDNVPDLFQLIYRNGMSKYLLGAQIFSTLFAGTVCLTLLINNDLKVKLPNELSPASPDYIHHEVILYLSVFIGFCVMMQFIISKMPIRIYNYPKQNEYIMIFYGALPMTTKRTTFKACEVIKLQESGILPWRESNYEIKDKGRIILLENYFRTPADLNIMLGYQKQSKD